MPKNEKLLKRLAIYINEEAFDFETRIGHSNIHNPLNLRLQKYVCQLESGDACDVDDVRPARAREEEEKAQIFPSERRAYYFISFEKKIFMNTKLTM